MLLFTLMRVKKSDHTATRSRLISLSLIHIALGLVFVAQIIAYDAAKLITPDQVLKRWIVTGCLIIAAAAVWYLAKLNHSVTVIRNLAWFLVAIDLFFASFYVYTTRGMASKSVLLFILPILTIAILRRKGALFLTSIIASVVYTSTAIAYFVLNFNEGYKVELYGEIGLYAAMLLVTGKLLWVLTKNER